MFFYFDNAATTKIKTEVLKEMMPYLTEEYGNPSALYSIGRKAKRAIEQAREQVANLINCDKNEIYFTSGGTESDNTAVKGLTYMVRSDHKNTDTTNMDNTEESDVSNDKKRHVITSKIEHHAILESCKYIEKHGYDITYLNVDKDGFINLEELKNAITENTDLISIMFANNEIGTIQPIEEISKIAKEKGIVFHTDAVQAIGNVAIDVREMGIDMLSLSGHKINGPKGIGALYIKKGIGIEKFIHGGHQEKNMRAGTENLAGIVGLGKACELAKENMESHISYVRNLRDYFIKQISKNIPNIKINGSLDQRLPGNCNISFKGIDSTELLLKLDKKGICISSGSACNSSEEAPSHVLQAIGLDEETARSSLRFTFGDDNTRAQVDYLIDNLTFFIGDGPF